jgi:hypothetical protein
MKGSFEVSISGGVGLEQPIAKARPVVKRMRLLM